MSSLEIILAVGFCLIILAMSYAVWKFLDWLEERFKKFFDRTIPFFTCALGLAAVAAAVNDALLYLGLINTQKLIAGDFLFLPGYLKLATNVFLITIFIPVGIVFFIIGLVLYFEEEG